ncbi:hypothetical protein TNCV_4183351 [Trichonephila clavipes]|nr:hypothetical protein TNCV_4183351 [Trichonephila clavipes]
MTLSHSELTAACIHSSAVAVSGTCCGRKQRGPRPKGLRTGLGGNERCAVDMHEGVSFQDRHGGEGCLIVS